MARNGARPKTNPDNPNDPIRVGDRVRSLDFAYPTALRHLPEAQSTFVEGRVIGFRYFEGCWRYEIEVERRVIEGREAPFNKPWVVIPPVNGTRILGSGDLTNGVAKLDADGNPVPATLAPQTDA